jgi:hypothetical protein
MIGSGLQMDLAVACVEPGYTVSFNARGTAQ